MEFFAKEKVNRGRQTEIDILKAFCIVCMILLHTYEDVGCDDNLLYFLVDEMCAYIGAGAFMICMGMGMRFSRHQEPGDYALRGFELLTVGQFLNLLRNTLPNLIAYWIKGNPFFISNSLLVLQADILTFAGLAFLLLALLKRLKLSDGVIFGIGVGLNLAAYALYGHMAYPDNFLLSQLLGFFVLTDAESYFPLLSYFVFVTAGFFIGGLYPRIRDKKALSKRVLTVCVPVCVIYYVLRKTVNLPLLPEFYSMEQYILQPGTDAIAMILVSLALLAVFYRIDQAYRSRRSMQQHSAESQPEGRILYLINHLSSNINQYYCISYMFILPMQTILVAVRGELMSGWLPATLYGLFVIAACYFIIEVNNKRLHWHLVTLRGTKRVVVFAGIWVLTIAAVAYAYPRITEYATFWNDYLLP